MPRSTDPSAYHLLDDDDDTSGIPGLVVDPPPAPVPSLIATPPVGVGPAPATTVVDSAARPGSDSSALHGSGGGGGGSDTPSDTSPRTSIGSASGAVAAPGGTTTPTASTGPVLRPTPAAAPKPMPVAKIKTYELIRFALGDVSGWHRSNSQFGSQDLTIVEKDTLRAAALQELFRRQCTAFRWMPGKFTDANSFPTEYTRFKNESKDWLDEIKNTPVQLVVILRESYDKQIKDLEAKVSKLQSTPALSSKIQAEIEQLEAQVAALQKEQAQKLQELQKKLEADLPTGEIQKALALEVDSLKKSLEHQATYATKIHQLDELLRYGYCTNQIKAYLKASPGFQNGDVKITKIDDQLEKTGCLKFSYELEAAASPFGGAPQKTSGTIVINKNEDMSTSFTCTMKNKDKQNIKTNIQLLLDLIGQEYKEKGKTPVKLQLELDGYQSHMTLREAQEFAREHFTKQSYGELVFPDDTALTIKVDAVNVNTKQIDNPPPSLITPPSPGGAAAGVDDDDDEAAVIDRSLTSGVVASPTPRT